MRELYVLIVLSVILFGCINSSKELTAESIDTKESTHVNEKIDSNVSINNCDPSYPTVCIPSPPPDLDCGEIPYKRFKVLVPDQHGFDGDNDGIGCER